MDRFFLRKSDWPSSAQKGFLLQLQGEEAHHCHRVMRKKKGDQIVLFDGQGCFGYGEIVESRKQEVVVKLLQAPSYEKKDISKVTLCQAIPKGKNMDWIIQKAVELGVSSIQPLVTERTLVKDGGRKQREKWQRIALEACKQCGQNWMPLVQKTRLFSSWIRMSSPKIGFIASLEKRAIPFKQGLEPLEKNTPKAPCLDLVIGPEGDFTPRELQEARDAGLIDVSLGKNTLRVETASLHALSIVIHRIS